MERQHQRMDGNGVWRFPEGGRRQRKVEKYCCNVICGAPTTVKVKGLTYEEEVFRLLQIHYCSTVNYSVVLLNICVIFS